MRTFSLRSWLRVLGTVALLCTAPVAIAADTPYVLPKKEFKKRIKYVSLSPLSVHESLNLSDDMRAFVEAEANTRLNKTKLQVLGIQPYAQLRATLAEQVGGLMTAEGLVDERRRTVVWDHAKREMRHRHPVDAFAEIGIRIVNAAFAKDRAEWDGVKQKVKSSGDGFALFGGPNYQGTIAALSFQLVIYDRSDELLFVNRGGIEVLQERQGAKLVLRDEAAMLQDQKSLKKAVQLAFKGL